jgi:hypothetical protein
MKLRVSYKDYYQSISLRHSTGDIWLNLPSLGLLKSKFCSGLIITPSCDLANSKVETITYLPIISLSEYLVSRAFYPVILNKIIALCNGINDYTASDLLEKNMLPTLADINFLITEYETKERDKAGNIAKIIIGLQLASDICNNEIKRVNKALLMSLFSEKENIKRSESVVRNSFSNDLHFLPKDERDEEWTAIKEHSVVLFRYPITAPIEVLELANDNTVSDWSQKMNEISASFPIAQTFRDKRPLKVYRLHEYFLSDLLTRFASLYIRIGSPDFDEDTVRQFSADLIK